MHQADVFQISRQGIRNARDRADEAVRSLADSGLQDAATAPDNQPQRDMARDMVELTRSAIDVRLNAQVARTGDSVAVEVVNLGRRIDVEA